MCAVKAFVGVVYSPVISVELTVVSGLDSQC